MIFYLIWIIFQSTLPHMLLLTCFIFNNAGSAVQPALTATASGDSTDKPIRAQASLTKSSATSCQRRLSSKCA